jgi:hypothetical protein
MEWQTGIPATTKEALQIYPNPVSVSGKLHLKVPETTDKKLCISIYSTEGEKMYSENKNKAMVNETLFLPEYLNKGIYLLKIQTENKIYHSKFIVN